MSNPDFPGPSWQDRSEFPAGSRPGQGGNRDPDYGGASAAGDATGYWVEPRNRGRGGAGGHQADDRGTGGYQAHPGGGPYAAEGPFPSGNGYGGNGQARNGNGHPAGYRGNGRLADSVPDVVPGGDPGGVGTDDIGRGHAKGYRGSAGRRRAAAEPGGPAGPYGLPRQRGPGGSGGPGRGGGSGGNGSGRGGGRGFVGPDGAPVRTPQNWPQRMWHASWWRHWTIKKAALLTGAIAAGTALLLIVGFFAVYQTVKVPIVALASPMQQASVVYFADGHTEVGSFSTVNRTVLTTAQLAQDKYLEAAFFAAEDRNFLHEGGVSLTGILRAIKVDLTGSGYQGASTITEQFVKTYYDPSGLGNLTAKEKLKEIIVAIKLAKLESKTWVLTHYLNAIYLGSGAYGVQAAAETYFGVPAWKLSIAQAAMIAAMVQYPSGFDPEHPSQLVPALGYSLLTRWALVLDNMVKDGAITQQQSNALAGSHQIAVKNFPKISSSHASSSGTGYRGYIMTAVQNELEQTYHLSKSEIEISGLQIVTTFSKPKMDALYAAVDEAKTMMRQAGRQLPNYAHIGAILENPKNGAIEAMYGGPNWAAKPKRCAVIHCQYNMATVARNQVGSSFKPYVLAAAVQHGMNVQDSVLNGYSPICVPPETMPMTESKRGGYPCPPGGYLQVDPDPVVQGPVSVAKAAALSSNAAFEDLAHRVGTVPIIDLAQRLGVDISTAASPKTPHGTGSGLINDKGEIGIALGIAPLTVEEQANTFAVFADNGLYHTPHVIAKMTQNGQAVPIKVLSHPVLSAAQTADVDWALSFDTQYGTGYPNAVLNPARPTIAKTGTTNVAQAAFFIGALPQQYSLAVGMFTNSQNNTKGGQTLDVLPSAGGIGGGYGGAWPATIWRLYMTRLLAMNPKPIAPLEPLDLNGDVKWVQVHAPPKPKRCPDGQPQRGGPLPCPAPTPTTTPTPTGSPTPTPSSSPSPSGSPSPSKSKSGGPPFGAQVRKPGHPRKPGPRPTGTPSLTSAATLPRPLLRRPVWAAVTSLG